MKIDEFLSEIRDLVQTASSGAEHGDVITVCNKFQKGLVDFLKVNKSQFEAKLAGLKACLENYVGLRQKWAKELEDADQLGHCIFMECARLVLDIEFHQLEETEEPRASFKAAITTTYTALQEFSSGHLFLVLQWLMVNYWSHATLVAMMQGEEVEEERALTYLKSGEYPELFKLRIEMLVESGCESHALNLCNWCVKSPVFSQDIMVRQTQLLLLHKFGRQAEFHNQCWQVQCCSGVKVIDSLFDQEEKQSACLMMAQTFLLQDWMQPKKYCCTKDLLNLWMLAQRLDEPDDTAFLNSVRKVVTIAKTTRQLVTLVAVMTKQFGTQFLQFCSEVSLKAIKMDRQMLDTARVKKIDEEANIAADGLAHTCRQVAETYSKHCQMCLGSLLTALYLEPKDDLFFQVEKHFQTYNEFPSEPDVPAGVEAETYKELFEIVELLRPRNFHPKVGWDTLRKRAIFHLEEGGFKYLPAEDKFESTEEKAIAKHQAKLKSKPRSQSTQSQKKVKDSIGAAPGTVQNVISTTKDIAPSHLPHVQKHDLEVSSLPEQSQSSVTEPTEDASTPECKGSTVQPGVSENPSEKASDSCTSAPDLSTVVTKPESNPDQHTPNSESQVPLVESQEVVNKETNEASVSEPSAGSVASTESTSLPNKQITPPAETCAKEVKTVDKTTVEESVKEELEEPIKDESVPELSKEPEKGDSGDVKKDSTGPVEKKEEVPEKGSDDSITKSSSQEKSKQGSEEENAVKDKPTSSRVKVIPPPLSGVKVPVATGSTPLDSPSVGSVTSTPTTTEAGGDFIPGMGKFVEEAALLDDCDLLQHISDFLQSGNEVEGGAPEEEEKGAKTPTPGQIKSPLKKKSPLAAAGTTHKNWKVTKEGPAIWQNRFQKSRAGAEVKNAVPGSSAKTEGAGPLSKTNRPGGSANGKANTKKNKSFNKPGPKSTKVNHGGDDPAEDGPGVLASLDAVSDAEENDQTIKFKCQFCKKAFNSMAERRRHQEWMCSKKDIAKAKEKERILDPSSPAVGAKTCKVCRRSFYNYSNLVRHIRNLHKEPMEAVMAYFGEPKVVGLKRCTVGVTKLNQSDLDKYNVELPPKPVPKAKEEEPPKYKRPQTAKRSGAKPGMKHFKDRKTRQKYRINYSEYFSDLESGSDWSSEYFDEVSEDTEDYYKTTTSSSESDGPGKKFIKPRGENMLNSFEEDVEEDDETEGELDLVVDMDALKNLESELEGEGPFLCDGCANVFDQKESLLKHECKKNLVTLKKTPEKQRPSPKYSHYPFPHAPNRNPAQAAAASRSKGPISSEVSEAMNRILDGALQKSVTRVYDAVPEVEDLQKENIEEQSSPPVPETPVPVLKNKIVKKKKPKPKSPVREGGKSPVREKGKTPGKEGGKSSTKEDGKEPGSGKKKKVDRKSSKNPATSGIIARALHKQPDQQVLANPLTPPSESPLGSPAIDFPPVVMTSMVNTVPVQQDNVTSSYGDAVTVASMHVGQVTSNETVVQASTLVNAQGQTVVLTTGDQLQVGIIQNGIPLADTAGHVVALDSDSAQKFEEMSGSTLGPQVTVESQFQPEESGLDILSQALQLSDVPNNEGEADYQMPGIFPLNDDSSQVQLTNFVQDSQGILWQTQGTIAPIEIAPDVDQSQTYVTETEVSETDDKKKPSKKKKKKPPAETVSKPPGQEPRPKQKSPVASEPPGGLSSELQEMINDSRVWITYRDCVFYKRLFIECSKCQEKFSSTKDCQAHQDTGSQGNGGCIPDPSSPNKKKTVFYCRNCDQPFTTRETVVNHMNGRCMMPTKTLGPEFFKFKCEHCLKGFCTQASMHAHVMSHKKDEIRRETRVVEKAKETDRDKLSAQMDLEFSHLSKHEADILKRAILSTLGHELEKQAAESEKEENKKTKKKRAIDKALDNAVAESFEMDHYEEEDENTTEKSEKTSDEQSVENMTTAMGDPLVQMQEPYVESAEHELMVDTEVQNVLVGQTISIDDSQGPILDGSNPVPLLAIVTQDSIQSALLPSTPGSLLPQTSGLPPVNMLFTQPTTSLSMQYSTQGSFLPRPIMSTGFQFTSTVSSSASGTPDSGPEPAQLMAQGGFLPQPIMSVSAQKSPVKSDDSADDSPKKNEKKSPMAKSKKVPRTSSPRTIKNLLAAIAAEKQTKPDDDLDSTSESIDGETIQSSQLEHFYGQGSSALGGLPDDAVVSYAGSEASDSIGGDDDSIIRDLEFLPDMTEPGELKSPARKRRKALMLNGRKVTQHMETTMYFSTTYVCGGCKIVHIDKKTYKQHVPNCTTGKPVMKIVMTFNCFYCNQTFERKKFCRTHMLKECPEAKNTDVAPTLPKPKAEKNVPCTMCSKKFSAKRWLYQHMIRNHDLEKHVAPPERIASPSDLETEYMVTIEKVPNPTYDIIGTTDIGEEKQLKIAEDVNPTCNFVEIVSDIAVHSEAPTFVTIVGDQDPNAGGNILQQTSLNPSYLTSQMSTVLPVPASPANSDGSNTSSSKSQLAVQASTLPLVSQASSTTTVVYATATQPTVTVQIPQPSPYDYVEDDPVQSPVDKEDSTAKNGVIEYKCDLCQKMFASENLLTYHQKYICAAKFGSHNKAEEWRCKYCKATFHHKVALKFHMRKCDQGVSYEKDKEKEKAEEPDKQPSPENTADGRRVRPRRSRSKSPASSKAEMSPRLRDTLVKKTLMHAEILNKEAERSKWLYMCKYCEKTYSKVLSLHSHVLSLHSAMYAKYRVGKDRKSPEKNAGKKKHATGHSEVVDRKQLSRETTPDPGTETLDTSREHEDIPSIPISEEDLTFLGGENVDEMISVLFAEEHEHSGSVNTSMEENVKDQKSVPGTVHSIDHDQLHEANHAEFAKPATEENVEQHSSTEKVPCDMSGEQHESASFITPNSEGIVLTTSTESCVESRGNVHSPYLPLSPSPVSVNPSEEPTGEKDSSGGQTDSGEESDAKMAGLGTINHETALSLGLGFSPPQSKDETNSEDDTGPRMIPEKLGENETVTAQEPLTCDVCAYKREFDTEFNLRCHMKWVHGNQYSDDEDGTKYGDPRLTDQEADKTQKNDGEGNDMPQKETSHEVALKDSQNPSPAAHEKSEVNEECTHIDHPKENESDCDGLHGCGQKIELQALDTSETSITKECGNNAIESCAYSEGIASQIGPQQAAMTPEVTSEDGETSTQLSDTKTPTVDIVNEHVAEPASDLMMSDVHDSVSEKDSQDVILAPDSNVPLSVVPGQQTESESQEQKLVEGTPEQDEVFLAREVLVEKTDNNSVTEAVGSCEILAEKAPQSEASSTEKMGNADSCTTAQEQPSVEQVKETLDDCAGSNTEPSKVAVEDVEDAIPDTKSEDTVPEVESIAPFPAKRFRSAKARRRAAAAARMRTRARNLATKKKESCEGQMEGIKSEALNTDPGSHPPGTDKQLIQLPESQPEGETSMLAKQERKKVQNKCLGLPVTQVNLHILNERPKRETRKRAASEPQEVSGGEPKDKIAKGGRLQDKQVVSSPRLRRKTTSLTTMKPTEEKVSRKPLDSIEKGKIVNKVGRPRLVKDLPESAVNPKLSTKKASQQPTAGIKKYGPRTKQGDIKLQSPRPMKNQGRSGLRARNTNNASLSKPSDGTKNSGKTSTRGKLTPNLKEVTKGKAATKAALSAKDSKPTRFAVQEARLAAKFPASQGKQKLARGRPMKTVVEAKKLETVETIKPKVIERKVGKLRVDLKNKTVAIVSEPAISSAKEDERNVDTEANVTGGKDDGEPEDICEDIIPSASSDKRFSLRARRKQQDKAPGKGKKDSSQEKKPIAKLQDTKNIVRNRGFARKARGMEKQPIVLVAKEELPGISLGEKKIMEPILEVGKGSSTPEGTVKDLQNQNSQEASPPTVETDLVESQSSGPCEQHSHFNLNTCEQQEQAKQSNLEENLTNSSSSGILCEDGAKIVATAISCSKDCSTEEQTGKTEATTPENKAGEMAEDGQKPCEIMGGSFGVCEGHVDNSKSEGVSRISTTSDIVDTIQETTCDQKSPPQDGESCIEEGKVDLKEPVSPEMEIQDIHMDHSEKSELGTSTSTAAINISSLDKEAFISTCNSPEECCGKPAEILPETSDLSKCVNDTSTSSTENMKIEISNDDHSAENQGPSDTLDEHSGSEKVKPCEPQENVPMSPRKSDPLNTELLASPKELQYTKVSSPECVSVAQESMASLDSSSLNIKPVTGVDNAVIKEDLVEETTSVVSPESLTEEDDTDLSSCTHMTSVPPNEERSCAASETPYELKGKDLDINIGEDHGERGAYMDRESKSVEGFVSVEQSKCQNNLPPSPKHGRFFKTVKKVMRRQTVSSFCRGMRIYTVVKNDNDIVGPGVADISISNKQVREGDALENSDPPAVSKCVGVQDQSKQCAAQVHKVLKRRSSLTQIHQAPKIVQRRSSWEVRPTSSPSSAVYRSSTPSPVTIAEQDNSPFSHSTIISVDKATGQVRVCSPVPIVAANTLPEAERADSPLIAIDGDSPCPIGGSKSSTELRVQSPVPQSTVRTTCDRPASSPIPCTTVLAISTHQNKISNTSQSVTKAVFNIGTATKITENKLPVVSKTVTSTTAALMTTSATSNSVFSANLKTYSTSSSVKVSNALPSTKMSSLVPSVSHANTKSLMTAARQTTFCASALSGKHGSSISKPVKLVRRGGKVGLHKTTEFMRNSDSGDHFISSSIKLDTRNNSPLFKKSPHVTVDSSKMRTNLVSQKYPWSCALCGKTFEHRHLWALHLHEEHERISSHDHESLFDHKPLVQLERIEKVCNLHKYNKSLAASVPNIDKEFRSSTPSPTMEAAKLSSGLSNPNSQSSGVIWNTLQPPKSMKDQDSEPDHDGGLLWSSDDDSPRLRNKVTVSYSKAQPLVRKELEFGKSLPGRGRDEQVENRFDAVVQRRSDSVESDRSTGSKTSHHSADSKVSVESAKSQASQCSKRSASSDCSIGQKRFKTVSPSDDTTHDKPIVLRNRIVISPVPALEYDKTLNHPDVDVDNANLFERAGSPATHCTRRKSSLDEGPSVKVLKRADGESVTDEGSTICGSPVRKTFLSSMDSAVDCASRSLDSKQTRRRIRSSESGTDGDGSQSGSPTRRLRSRAGSLDGANLSQESHLHCYNTRRGSDSSLSGKLPSLRTRTPTPTQLSTKDPKQCAAQRTRKSSQSHSKSSEPEARDVCEQTSSSSSNAKQVISTRSSGRQKAPAH